MEYAGADRVPVSEAHARCVVVDDGGSVKEVGTGAAYIAGEEIGVAE